MQDNQNFVFGGLDTDSDLRTVKSDRYIDGNDIEHFVDETNELGGIRRMKGTKLAYTIPSITPQFNRYRFPFITTSSTDYRVTVTGPTYTQFSTLSAYPSGITPDATGLGQFGVLLEANITDSYAYTVVPYQTAALSNGAFRLDIINSTSYTITVETKPNGTTEWVKQTAILLQEPISYTAELEPLASALIGDKEFVLSRAVNQSYCEIGCAVRSIDETWTYTRLAGSTSFNFPTSEVIDLRAEILGNDRIGLYWVDSTNKPKVFYCQDNLAIPVFRYVWTSIGGLQGVYLNKLGSYNLNSIKVQTDLQIFNNKATVTTVRQIATGGALKSGGKRYYVRFGVNGTENTTPFNDIGEYTIVYKADNEAPRNAVKIKGDNTPETTTKQIVLRVDNCMSDVFNFVELVCVEYEGGGTSAVLVDRYDITAESIEITHSGNELRSEPFDPAGILNVKPVILKGKTNEIKKNRYNIANVEIDGDSDVYAEIARNITIQSARKEISRVGEIYTGDSNTEAFKASNYVRDIQNVAGPLSVGGTFFTDDPNVIIVNPFSAFSNGVYTATSSTAGVNKILFNYRIYTYLIPSANDFARVVVYHLNSDDTVKSILIDNVYKPQEVQGGQRGEIILDVTEQIEKNITITAGEKVRADWFVQGQNGWEVSSDGLSAIVGQIDNFNFGKNLAENEYQKAENVSNNMGYMMYEEYPFYIRFHKKSGYTTSPYFIGTHTITPEDFGDFVVGYGIDVSLTTPSGNPYVYHPVFSNIDLTSIRDDISGFSIWRGDIKNPKVLSCGVNLMANKASNGEFYAGFYASNPTGTLYGTAFPSISASERRYSAFISPDNIVKNGELVRYQTDDVMYVAGQPTIFAASANNNVASSIGGKRGSFIEFTGYCPRATSAATDSPEVINDAQFTPFRQQTDRYLFNNIAGANNPIKLVLNGDGTFFPSIDTASLAVSFDAPISPVAARLSEDYGVYLAYYYRGSNKLDTESINVVDCNAYYNLTDEVGATTINNFDVFGGDTYTQKNYLRLLYSSAELNVPNLETATKYESFITFYTQNRFNTQMRKTVEEGCVLFPADAESVSQYLDDDREEIYSIDEGYNQQSNTLTSARPYSDKIAIQTKFPTRIYYTAQRPTGSSYDSFRDISPLDFKDLDGKNGQISALYDINDTMIALQKFAVSVLPYQSDVLLKSDAGAEIYVGNGGVYAQRETIIGTYGTDIQTNSFRGFNRNGNASLYWFSEVTKKVFRYGRDGIQCLSDNAKTRNFFLSRTKFVENEFDIVMGFDTKRDNLWITSNAYKQSVAEWNSGSDYFIGNIVALNDVNFYSYPLFYRAIQDGFNKYPLTQTEYWEQIPLSDGDYYSIFTILFNEKLNTFTTLSGALPNRYFQYNNELLVPNVRSSWGKVYELNNGTNKYFDGFDIDFYVQPIVNKIQNTTKRFLSIGLNTGEEQINYPSVDFQTKLQESVSSEFEQKNGNIFIAVEPDSNGEPLTGEYMKFKVSTNKDITLLDGVAKIYYRPRLPR